MRIFLIKIPVIMLFIMVHDFSIAFAQEGETGQYQLFKSKTFVKNPLDLRDPFKRKNFKKKINNEKTESALSGKYSNANKSLEGVSIESLMVTGVIIGDEKRAVVTIAKNENGDRETYFLKEGMRIGINNAEVKAILPGGIVLVEKIRNVYDLDEYLETVIPLSR